MPSLGTSQLGTELLSGSVTRVSINPAVSVTTERELDSTTTADAITTATSVVTSTKQITPISLSPENLYVQFNEESSEFQSTWFEKETPLEETGELVIVGKFRRERDEPVQVVVERDDTGNKTPNATSEVKTLSSDTHILRIQTDTKGNPLAKNAANYRIRFPGYTQSNAIERLTLALGWNNVGKFNAEWDLRSIDTKEQPTAALIALLLTENSRLDATVDEVFKQQHIESATDSSLDLLSKEVGAERKKRENDEHLRKRVLSRSATRTFSTTGSDVSDLVGLIFDERGGEITIGVLPDKPVLQVTAPQTVVDEHILTQSEIEELLNDGVSSSYNAVVTTI
jgi:hypothetical protein